MKITSVRCILLSAPYATSDDAERMRHLRTGYRPSAFIRIETDPGIMGLCETYAGLYAPEAVRPLVAQFNHDLKELGAFPTRKGSERLRLASHYWARAGLSQSVLGGIEIALWGLKGKILDQPVWQLLGGKAHDAIPVYASGGNDKAFDELLRELEGYRAQGFGSEKIRINILLEGEIEEQVAFCRRVVGDGVGLAVDAAQGLSPRPWPVKQTLAIATRLEPHYLLWIEERDATLIGGISAFRRVAQMCERHFVPIAVHAWCGGVGIMGNYHAAFATPNCTILELPNVPNPLRDEVLVEPLDLRAGTLSLTSAPGHGVELPPDLEERYPYRPGSVYRIVEPLAPSSQAGAAL